MPVGTPVRAAREGTVVVVRDDHTRRCPDVNCADEANYVLLRHDDGSVAEYGHLAFRGVYVRAGQCVARAQVIATSGATGRVTAPHLHFVVRLARRRRHVAQRCDALRAHRWRARRTPRRGALRSDAVTCTCEPSPSRLLRRCATASRESHVARLRRHPQCRPLRRVVVRVLQLVGLFRGRGAPCSEAVRRGDVVPTRS